MSRRPSQIGLACMLCLSVLSCSDTSLYSTQDPRRQADRVALRGRVCSEDPVQAKFPVRVILVADRAAGPLFAGYDLAGERFDALEQFIQSTLSNPDASIAVIGYDGRPRKLAPEEGSFTRNPGELLNSINQLSLAQNCAAENRCRTRREALKTARALIEGDLAQSPDGRKVLTQYIVVFLDAGPASPMALGRTCCQEDDTECIEQGGDPSPVCEALLSAQEVAALRDEVEESGAAGLRLHTVHLAAEIDADVNEQVGDTLEAMAFAGGGSYQRYDSPGGLAFRALDLLGLRTTLRAKLLGVSNLNAKPGPNGPRVDSDADGLADEEEEALGTLLESPDSDGDGITDYVETLVGFDPTMIDTPRACETLTIGSDQDLDGLTDCDEELLGTSPSLVDSDGDGLPDRIEIVGLTDYLNPDAEQDEDGDGVNNGDELLLHADPKSTDTREHLRSGYRYEIEDEGFVRELFASTPQLVTGVEIVEISQGTTPGVGTLFWDATARTLQWQDVEDTRPGPAVSIEGAGDALLELPSSSWAPIQGDEGKIVRVRVSEVDLPPNGLSEFVRIVFRVRQCLQYTVRNVGLMATRERADGTPAGYNDLLLFLAQTPSDKGVVPGPVRQALVPVIFEPPATRIPDGAILQIEDEIFVRPNF